MHIREQRDKMRQKIQEATVASSLKKGMYAVVAIENNKVLPNSMAWDFNETEIVLYANMLRTKHPQATISIEAKGGRISQVLKPGELFKEAHAVELKPGTRVKTPHGRGKIVRYDKGDGPHGSPYYIVDVGKQASEKVMAHQLQREETMIGPGSRVKTPYGIGQVVRYDKVEKLYIVDVGKNAFNKVTPPTWIVGQAKKVKPNQIQREDAPMGPPKAPSDVDRLKVRQATDTITLKQRQATELMAAKIRDVETKARAAQTKASAPKGAAASAS